MRTIIAVAALLAASPAFAQDQNAEGQQTEEAQAAPGGATMPANSELSEPLIGNDGQPVGNMFLTDTPNGVLVRLQIMADALPEGEHAMHFHEVGDCSDTAAFEKAGGHFDPTSSQHGFLVEEGPHAGDMENFTIAAGVENGVQAFDPMVRFTEGEGALMDDDGTALIIHAGVDDYSSQPAGNSGDRLACAQITGQ
jgi:superoxide dismutase, Cu-Zn family